MDGLQTTGAERMVSGIPAPQRSSEYGMLSIDYGIPEKRPELRFMQQRLGWSYEGKLLLGTVVCVFLL